MSIFNLGEKQIDFMKQRRLALALSLTLIVLSIVGMAVRGFNFGIDFTGGTVIEVAYPQPVELAEVRDTLRQGGFDKVIVQHFGSATDVLIRIQPREGMTSAMISNQVLELLRKQNPKVELRRVEYVGPQVGDELTEDGALAVLYALIGILIYVAFRFEFRFALGSIAALVHDVIITLGVFAWTQAQFDLTVLAAVLAVIGYSLNDTIVVFDRIRENFRLLRDKTPEEVMNISINQTLSRTIMTSLTTLLVVFALFFLGGEIIHNFALALLVGIGVGTYSSIYVASALALMLGVSKEDLTPPPKDEVDREALEREMQQAFLEAEARRQQAKS
ncbi:protein translocase subunit SecF [Sulfurivirga sp.]|uniref:protein translocase subunit SecF n=1 Tax=Sulfurivirga sp. TaxID=2614236 RepID=UPI0025D1DB96|nr:protein translocase subunit SecF [Sulfurivirga sp.]